MNRFDERPAPGKPDTRPPDDPARSDDPPVDVTATGVGQVNTTLFKSRIVTIFGEVNDRLAKDTVAQLLALTSLNKNPIRIFLNTPGGHVESGDSMHDMIRFVDAPIQMVGTGWVASAGVLIYLGAKKGNRFCLPNTRFMMHQPIGAFRGQASDALIHANEVRKMRERLNQIFARETGQNIERIRKDTDRDYWLTAEEAREYGIVDRIVNDIGELNSK